jgi:inorganic pyrophosphatase
MRANILYRLEIRVSICTEIQGVFKGFQAYIWCMILHPWHEVEHDFDKKNALVKGIVEISQGSKAKYEVDKKSGLLKLDRVVFAAFHYPINYGFIPQTLGEDGDPLDILVLSQIPIQPLCLVKTKVIGYMEMLDNGEKDEKIIAVAQGDMSVSHINSIEELPENYKLEMKHFFSEYKTLSKKTVVVDEFLPAKEALQIVEECIKRYKKKYKK